MFGTDHHAAFAQWWRFAEQNYVSWEGERPAGLDLYYDPVVDEHVGHGPMGIVVPTWYLAPQQPEIARAGWHLASTLHGVVGEGPISGLENPALATQLLQIAGEFADPATKARIWAAAEPHVEPTWNADLGEFTLGFGLGEAHPRGQWNARTMAGWVCTQGAWSRIFNEPNLVKFHEPTVEGVDFPRVAMSEARWDGRALHLAAAPQNDDVRGSKTQVRIINLPNHASWRVHYSGGRSVALPGGRATLDVELTVDNRPARIMRS
ncbi:MAG: hypothetical protein R3E86_19245 [Pseudomonadales bacterium]